MNGQYWHFSVPPGLQLSCFTGCIYNNIEFQWCSTQIIHFLTTYQCNKLLVFVHFCSKALMNSVFLFHCRIRDTSNKPRKEYIPKPRTSLDFSISENHNGGIHSARSPGESGNTNLIVQKHVQKLAWVDTLQSFIRESHTFVCLKNRIYLTVQGRFWASFYLPMIFFPLTRSMFLFLLWILKLKPVLKWWSSQFSQHFYSLFN